VSQIMNYGKKIWVASVSSGIFGKIPHNKIEIM